MNWLIANNNNSYSPEDVNTMLSEENKLSMLKKGENIEWYKTNDEDFMIDPSSHCLSQNFLPLYDCKYFDIPF